MNNLLAAAIDDPTAAMGTALGLVLAFAGMLIVRLNRLQTAVWELVLQLQKDNHWLRWQLEYERSLRGEAPNPGEFKPWKQT